jgi:hypothetical protein
MFTYLPGRRPTDLATRAAAIPCWEASLRTGYLSNSNQGRGDMDWSALSAIGELVGAAAVVASLLYVGQQVRQSNRIARAEAFRAVQTRMADLLGDWAADPEWRADFVQIRYQGIRREDLDPARRIRAGIHLQRLVTLYSTIHRDVLMGMLPSSAYTIQAEAVFRTPYIRDVWPILKLDHSEEFVKFFEARFGLGDEPSDSVTRLPPPVEIS